jgi:hypothetical protein
MKPHSCTAILQDSFGFFSFLIPDKIPRERWGMLRVFRPGTEEGREAFFDPGALWDATVWTNWILYGFCSVETGMNPSGSLQNHENR